MSRQAILVLGMHRSGTSLVTGLLVRLGVQGPRTLMPADAGNRAGYWESAVLCEFHERLLRAAGSQWDTYSRLDLRWLQSQAAAGMGDECRQLLQAEFGDAPRFVLKDPRICRFVPFWLQILKREDIAPAAVLVLRDPFDVARSLRERNGFDRDVSLLVWLRHVLDAELDTRTIPRTFVRYLDVLQDWRSVTRRISRDLAAPWAAGPPADEAEVDRFVNAGLRHDDETLDRSTLTPVLSDWVRRAWAALEWLHDRDPGRVTAAFDALDGVRVEFDRAATAFDGVRAQIVHLEHEQRALRDQTARLEALRDGLEYRVESLERHTAALERELSAAQQDAKAVRESASWRITAPLRAVYRVFR